MIQTSLKPLFLAAEKPPLVRSFAFLQQIQKKLPFPTKKIGHSGTLDSFAEGLMLLMIDKGCLFFDDFLQWKKGYLTLFQLGSSTPSYDPTEPIDESIPIDEVWARLGNLPKRSFPIWDPPPLIRQAIALIESRSTQIPPAYSAKKIQGRRAADHIRKGIDPTSLPLREIEVEIRIPLYGLLDRETLIAVFFVSSGTYIRAIARDLGEILGIPIHVKSLLRFSIGPVFLLPQNIKKWPVAVLKSQPPILTISPSGELPTAALDPFPLWSSTFPYVVYPKRLLPNAPVPLDLYAQIEAEIRRWPPKPSPHPIAQLSIFGQPIDVFWKDMVSYSRPSIVVFGPNRQMLLKAMQKDRIKTKWLFNQ